MLCISDNYSLLMSSVPGLPVEIDTEAYTDDLKLGLLVSSSYGEFNLWNEEGLITQVGNNATFDFEDVTVYWTPALGSETEMPENANIVVSIYEIKTAEVVNEIVGVLSIDDKLNYSVDFRSN